MPVPGISSKDMPFMIAAQMRHYVEIFLTLKGIKSCTIIWHPFATETFTRLYVMRHIIPPSKSSIMLTSTSKSYRSLQTHHQKIQTQNLRLRAPPNRPRNHDRNGPAPTRRILAGRLDLRRRALSPMARHPRHILHAHANPHRPP